MSNYTVKIVSNTKEAISELLSLRESGPYVFRGHRNHEWKLGPHHMPLSMGRTMQEGLHQVLDDNRRQFVRRCRAFAKFTLREHDYWESLFLAQHFGLKTRLLDWTSDPLVALYFAVDNILTKLDEANTYGCVWAIEVPKGKWIEHEDLPGYGGRKTEKWQLAGWVMINPPLIEDRLTRQSIKFSYHPTIDDDDISVLQRAPGERLVKLIIGDINQKWNPADRIRRELGIMNVHYASLFPDCAGVAQYINKQWRVIARESAGLADRDLSSQMDNVEGPTLLKIAPTVRLTPASLRDDIIPTLEGLESLERVANEASGRPFRGAISSISQHSPISISLQGFKEAVELALDWVIPWRRKHAEALAALRMRQQEIEVERASIQNRQMEVALAASKVELAERLLKVCDPNQKLSSRHRERLLQQLVTGIDLMSKTTVEFLAVGPKSAVEPPSEEY